MKVPFFGLDRQYKMYRDSFIEISDQVLSTGNVLQGEHTKALEQLLCKITARKYGVAVGSATDALAFALMSLNIGTDDEVLVTSFSFFASVSPIVRVGARPVFVDIDPDYYMMELNRIEEMITSRTKAILAVHLYGQTLPMKQLEGLAVKHNLVIIEDAAQSLGSFDETRPAGSMGQVSCISFDPTKIIGSFSSAGALVTDDPDIFNKCVALRYHGRNTQTRRYEILGFNSQLAEEMAAMLVFKVNQLENWVKERDRVAGIYLNNLDTIPSIRLPKIREGSGHNWHKFVMRASNRDGLQKHLKENGIETMIHYPKALCDEPLIQQLMEKPVAVPVSRKAAEEVISLPIFPEITNDEAAYVVKSIREFYSR